MSDFNAEPADTTPSDFCLLIKDQTSFKNPNKASCIDLINANRPKCFQNFIVFEIRLSGFHAMCVTIIKIYYSNQKPAIIHDRKVKKFNNDAFINNLNTLAILFDAIRELLNASLEK